MVFVLTLSAVVALALVNVSSAFMTDAQPPETTEPSKSPLNAPTPSTEPFA
jgi:hypothetical protein